MLVASDQTGIERRNRPASTLFTAGRGRLSAPRWELAMHRTIQANHNALNVLAVCTVFVFVGAVLLGAF
jgi:hypothetical protein